MADPAPNAGSIVPNAGGAPPAGGNQPPPGGTPDAITIAPELSEWAKAKGYGDFETRAKADPTFYKMATSYRETEKFIGGDKIPLPKDMNDAEAMKSVFAKLGTPADAKEYKLSVPEGQDAAFANAFRGAAHEANLTQGQAAKLNTWWNGMVDGIIKGEDSQRAEKAAADKIGLEKDWGGSFDANKEVAERMRNTLASELGIPRDKLTDGLEETFGLRDAMRILNFLGVKSNVAGDTFEGGEHGGNRGGGIQLTPDQARDEKGKLLADRDFALAYKQGKTEARQKLADLNAIIGAEGAPPAKITQGDARRR